MRCRHHLITDRLLRNDIQAGRAAHCFTGYVESYSVLDHFGNRHSSRPCRPLLYRLCRILRSHWIFWEPPRVASRAAHCRIGSVEPYSVLDHFESRGRPPRVASRAAQGRQPCRPFAPAVPPICASRAAHLRQPCRPFALAVPPIRASRAAHFRFVGGHSARFVALTRCFLQQRRDTSSPKKPRENEGLCRFILHHHSCKTFSLVYD